MYKMTLTIENPMAGLRKAMVYQFDENAMTQTKWNGAYPSVDAEIQALKTASAAEGKEPPVW